MFLSDEQVNSRLHNPSNLTKRETKKPRRQLEDKSERKDARTEIIDVETGEVIITPTNNGGRRGGDKNMSPKMRALVGAVAQVDTLENTANAFGVSKHHVHELKHGKHSNAQGQNEELIEEVNAQLAKPHDLALSKLVDTLTAITPDKIQRTVKAKDLASVAASLARVAQATAPIKEVGTGLDGTRLVVYAPTFKQENNYQTVTVQRDNPA